ncbi:hypothetical protein BJ912DRAFT_801757, partial [Pholiota molesta]
INHWAIPQDIWQTMEEEKEAAKRGKPTMKQQQQQLQFKAVTGPREFTRMGILHAVGSLIATNNQPLALVDNLAFRNSLIAMRPKTTTADLPSSYDVKVYLHNEFVKYISELKKSIMV